MFRSHETGQEVWAYSQYIYIFLSATKTGQEVWAYSQYIYIFLSATKNAQQSEPTDHSDSGPRQLSQLATTSTR